MHDIIAKTQKYSSLRPSAKNSNGKQGPSQDPLNSHKRHQNLLRGSQHPGILRVATWNVQGASPSKMPGIYNALEEHCIDICTLTETKWTFVTGDWHVLDKRWRAARVDFDSAEMDRANIPSLQRGSLCLLVRSSLQAEAFLLQKREGPLNMAQWRLMSLKWTSNIVLSGVYRSPSDNTTAVVEEQMQVIEAYMDTPEQKAGHPAYGW